MTDKEEIKRLNIELQSMRSAANSYKMHYEKAQTEIERLQKNIDGLNIFTKNHIKVIRLQAIIEFWEMLKEEIRCEDDCGYHCHECHFECKDYVISGDNLVKEMMEVNEK